MSTGMEPKKATADARGYRTERDPVGEKRMPLDVLYGIQALRALENFQITHERRDADCHADRMYTELREYAERSVGVAALYNEERGFMGAAELAQKAIDTGKSVKEVAAEE